MIESLRWLYLTQQWELLNEAPERYALHIAWIEQLIRELGYRRVGNDWQPLNQWLGEEADEKQPEVQPGGESPSPSLQLPNGAVEVFSADANLRAIICLPQP